VLFYEDATGGGLHSLVRAMARSRRKSEKRPPFSYFKDYPRKGNARLVRDCATFPLVRFRAPHRADHVFAVIDAYEVEKVIPKAPAPPAPDTADGPFGTYCTALHDAVVKHLQEQAMGDLSEKQRTDELPRFHPHVLFWERESVILAGAASLGKAGGPNFEPEATSPRALLRRRNPAAFIDRAFRDQAKGKYQKSIDGPELLGLIEADSDGWETVLERVPSLRELVEDLAAI